MDLLYNHDFLLGKVVYLKLKALIQKISDKKDNHLIGLEEIWKLYRKNIEGHSMEDYLRVEQLLAAWRRGVPVEPRK